MFPLSFLVSSIVSFLVYFLVFLLAFLLSFRFAVTHSAGHPEHSRELLELIEWATASICYIEARRQEEGCRNKTRTNQNYVEKREGRPKLYVTCLVDCPLQPGHKTPSNPSSQREQGPIVHTRIALTQRAAQFLPYRPDECRL